MNDLEKSVSDPNQNPQFHQNCISRERVEGEIEKMTKFYGHVQRARNIRLLLNDLSSSLLKKDGKD